MLQDLTNLSSLSLDRKTKILINFMYVGFFFFFFFNVTIRTLSKRRKFRLSLINWRNEERKKESTLFALNIYRLPTVPIFLEWQISDSHRNIFIVITQSAFLYLSDKLISNNFSGLKMDFHFRKKSEQCIYISGVA